MSSAEEIRHAILAALSAGQSVPEMIEFLKVPKATVYHVKKKFHQEMEDPAARRPHAPLGPQEDPVLLVEGGGRS